MRTITALLLGLGMATPALAHQAADQTQHDRWTNQGRQPDVHQNHDNSRHLPGSPPSAPMNPGARGPGPNNGEPPHAYLPGRITSDGGPARPQPLSPPGQGHWDRAGANRFDPGDARGPGWDPQHRPGGPGPWQGMPERLGDRPDMPSRSIREGGQYGRSAQGLTPGRGSPQGNWNQGWRQDQRFDWSRFRQAEPGRFRARPYYAPPGFAYRPWYPGLRIGPWFYQRNYWLQDPLFFHLPPPPPGCAWVRYFNDVALVNLYDGTVLDVVPGFFY